MALCGWTVILQWGFSPILMEMPLPHSFLPGKVRHGAFTARYSNQPSLGSSQHKLAPDASCA